ncbi:unnamed protein product [Fraxinus pennsylvanica]|uniref:Uncharacterized protein n=1 Tax=Fraxinus pennsylvanica TaxID=56036 RepID=A0AAD1YRM9_9LAMI|nr:unnamed protein product [Fraxinus pennsylvanica]
MDCVFQFFSGRGGCGWGLSIPLRRQQKLMTRLRILMSGRNAITNFPIVANEDGNDNSSTSPSSSSLSSILDAKLRKCDKWQYPSITCLRLDPEKPHIGVWQKGAEVQSDSNWVMTVELGKKNSEC